jgi:hypothetical protein
MQSLDLVEILTPTDLQRLPPAVRRYLQGRLATLESPPDPATEGYFVYLEDPRVLTHPLVLRHTTLPSLEAGLLRHLEGVVGNGELLELAVLPNNEFLLSLVLPRTPWLEQQLRPYLSELPHD